MPLSPPCSAGASAVQHPPQCRALRPQSGPQVRAGARQRADRHRITIYGDETGRGAAAQQRARRCAGSDAPDRHRDRAPDFITAGYGWFLIIAPSWRRPAIRRQPVVRRVDDGSRRIQPGQQSLLVRRQFRHDRRLASDASAHRQLPLRSARHGGAARKRRADRHRRDGRRQDGLRPPPSPADQTDLLLESRIEIAPGSTSSSWPSRALRRRWCSRQSPGCGPGALDGSSCRRTAPSRSCRDARTSRWRPLRAALAYPAEPGHHREPGASRCAHAKWAWTISSRSLDRRSVWDQELTDDEQLLAFARLTPCSTPNGWLSTRRLTVSTTRCASASGDLQRTVRRCSRREHRPGVAGSPSSPTSST